MLELILKYLAEAEDRFNAPFGGHIFEELGSISGVDVEGPPLEDFKFRF